MFGTDTHIYTKRPGAGSNLGQTYEVKMACLMYLRGLASGNKFLLASNLNGAGDFDDLVLQLYDDDDTTRRTYFVQLKHKANKDVVIPRPKFLSLNTRNDFSLLKYFLSFRDKILPQFKSEVVLVLYTNVGVQYEPDVSNHLDEVLNTNPGGLIFSFKEDTDRDVFAFVQHIQLYAGFLEQLRDEVDESIIKNKISKFIDDYKSKYPIEQRQGNINICEIVNQLKIKPDLQQITDQIKKISDLGDLSHYRSFLNKLKICTRQTSEPDLDVLIRQELSQLLGGDSAPVWCNLLTQVQHWWASDQGTYLTEESPLWDDTVRRVLSLMNNRIIRKISTLGIRFQEEEELKSSLTSPRVVLYLVEGASVKIGVCKVLQTLQKMNSKYLFGMSENVLLFWQNRWCNLLVVELGKEDLEMVYTLNELLERQPGKSVILVARRRDVKVIEAVRNLMENTEVSFRINLGVLDQESQKQVLSKKIMFQRHSVTLRDLTKGQQGLIDGVLEEILKDEPMDIGIPLEELMSHYIPRTLQRCDILKRHLMREFFEESCSVFAITGICDEELVQLVPFGEKVLQFDGKLTPGCRFYRLESKDLIRIKEKVVDYIFVAKQKGDFHVLEFNSDINMKRFVDTDRFNTLGPDTVFDLPGRVVIVAAEPGMGKSTLTTSMALKTKEEEPATWVVRINLRSTTTILDTTREVSVDFLTKASGMTDPFQKLLFKYSVEVMGNVVVFFDGFDEICPDYEDQILEIFQYLLQTNIRKIMITSRLHRRLEQSVSAIHFSIREFTSEDQRRYLTNVWSERVPDVDRDHLNTFISDVLGLFSDSLYDYDLKFLGTPLQTHLVAEVFEQHLKEGHGPKRMDIKDLYEEFFRKKCRVYFEEKRGDNVTQPLVRKEIKIKMKYIEHMHILSAVVLYMPSKDLDEESLTVGTDYLIGQKNEWLTIGMIRLNAEGKPEFLHRTIMEFFVSKWLLNNYRWNTPLIQKRFFSENYVVVRVMLNVMLAQGYFLHTAILNSDVEALRQNLNHQNVNCVDEGGRTLLHTVLTGGTSHAKFRDMVDLLLSLGADINATDHLLRWSVLQYADYSENWVALGMILTERRIAPDLDHVQYRATPALATACKEGCVQLARYIVENCVQDESDYLDGFLHVAAQHGQDNVLDYLLGVGARVDAAGRRGKYTALHLAVKNGHVGAVLSLIRAGANVDATGKLDITPLHLAAMNGHIIIVRILLMRGANSKIEFESSTTLDLSRVDCYSEIYYLDRKYGPPLNSAVRQGDINTVQVLLGGYKTEFNTGGNDKTPLHIAAALGYQDIARVLIENGSPVDVLDDSGATPLHIAVITGHLEVVRLLLEKGSSVNRLVGGISPVHLAADMGHLDIIKCLVENCECVCSSGSHSGGHWSVLRRFINKTSSVGCRDTDRMTPLHYVALNGHVGTVQFLIEKGSQVNVEDNEDMTPLHCACDHGHLDTVRLLLENGSEVDVRNKDNLTPLHLAASKGHYDIVHLLIKKGNRVGR